MIYLDNAATTKMFEKSVEVYKDYACRNFFNPSAGYKISLEISKELEQVRKNLMQKLDVNSGNVIFTGGATESNNLAILGSKRNGKWEYVFSEGEHPSVYNVARKIEQDGNIVHFVKLRSDGQIDYEKLKDIVNERTRLISTIHVSNETGAVNNLFLINQIRKEKAPNALFHVDGVQAFCKIPFSLKDFGADFYTISAHKFHGPKGVGALYVRNTQMLKNIIYGGGQEFGFRSGTENVPGIMAMNYAFSNIDVNKNFKIVTNLKKTLLSILLKDENVSYLETDSPYILSVGFKGVNGETLMRALQDKEIYVGTGSACSTKKAGNRVLESLGQTKDQIKTHIRISLDSELTEKEIVSAGKLILDTYYEIWEKVK